MIKKITFFVALFISISTFCQETEGDRAGTIFYSTIDTNESNYSLYIDLFEPELTTYIEAELYDDNQVKLSSILVKLIKENKIYYVHNKETDTKVKVVPQDINLTLEKTTQVNYPTIKIKLLDKNFDMIDFSKKIFY